LGTHRAYGSTDLEVVGSLAYMETGGSDILIVDVSGPRNPVELRVSESGIEFGDTEACLRGELFEGLRFRACAALRTVPGR